jgi:hypothetical protein
MQMMANAPARTVRKRLTQDQVLKKFSQRGLTPELSRDAQRPSVVLHDSA